MGWAPPGGIEANLAAWYLGGIASLVAEASFQRRARRSGAPRWHRSGEDRGTFFLVLGSLVLADGFPFVAYLTGPWTRLAPLLAVPGVLLIATGIVVRGSALRTLGRNFSVVVETRAEQRLVRDGLYRRLRHPSYTANLLVTMGLALTVPTLEGMAVALLVVLAGHLARIRVEEQALRIRFPKEYEEYAGSTWRLIPGIY